MTSKVELQIQSADLVKRFQRTADRDDFACLVRRHQGPVRGLLLRLVKGDQALADDLAQETFLSAFRAIDQFRAEAKFTTWLYRIAWNAFLQHERKSTPRVVEDLDPEHFASSLAPGGDLKMDLEKAMYLLSPEVRTAITLNLSLGLTHEETAAALDLPLGTVKSHITRGRQQLRQQLAAWEHKAAT